MSEQKVLPIHHVARTIERVVTNIPPGEPSFGDSRYQPLDLTTKNFFALPKLARIGKMAFVDGGSAELLSAPNFAVGLTRVYFGLFENDRRLQPLDLPSRIDFFTLCYASPISNRICYKTEIVPVKEEWREFLPEISDLEFDSFDQTIMVGTQRAAINRVLEVSRAFSEWRLAKLVMEKELEEGDILVRDGTLQSAVTNESKYADETIEVAKKRRVWLTALSKTSTLFTDTGQPLFSVIQLMSENSEFKNLSWYYHPIVNINHPNHRAEMFGVKLHHNSPYVFRLEIFKDQVDRRNLGEVGSVISSLASNSKDIGFTGYPYGLIDADKFARVSMKEKAAYEFQIRAILSSQKEVWDKISAFIRSSDAHQTLNKLIG